MPDLLETLAALADGQTLTVSQSSSAFEQIMSGDADPVQVAAFLMALRVRGETVDEIVGGAQALRGKAALLSNMGDVVDTCGTGGDGIGTYNISTAAAIVAAATGCKIAKHGNRSVSSKSGSADVLMALGAKLDISLADNEESLRRHGFTFMFAPAHHQAMKHVAPVRAALKLRTIFNLLGPLANPAQAKRQVLGVFDRRWLRPMAEVLKALGSQHVWVVHGEDGLDELTVTGKTHVVELKDGKIREFDVMPTEVGLAVSDIDSLKGGDAEMNAAALKDLLAGDKSSYRDITLLNTAAALVVADKAANLGEGVQMAAKAIDSGAATQLLSDWISFTQTTGTHAAGGSA